MIYPPPTPSHLYLYLSIRPPSPPRMINISWWCYITTEEAKLSLDFVPNVLSVATVLTPYLVPSTHTTLHSHPTTPQPTITTTAWGTASTASDKPTETGQGLVSLRYTARPYSEISRCTSTLSLSPTPGGHLSEGDIPIPHFSSPWLYPRHNFHHHVAETLQEEAYPWGYNTRLCAKNKYELNHHQTEMY